MSKLTLERAKELLPKHTTEDHLFVHAACVSAAMGAMADYFGEDRDHWEAIGWLGVDEADIRSIISHGYGITTDEVAPESNLEKNLFTVDELTGIVHAYALMRPEKMDGMSVKSFKKKFKDLKFAAKCDREVINRGFEMLGLEPSVVMQACIDGMTAHKEEIGL